MPVITCEKEKVKFEKKQELWFARHDTTIFFSCRYKNLSNCYVNMNCRIKSSDVAIGVHKDLAVRFQVYRTLKIAEGSVFLLITLKRLAWSIHSSKWRLYENVFDGAHYKPNTRFICFTTILIVKIRILHVRHTDEKGIGACNSMTFQNNSEIRFRRSVQLLYEMKVDLWWNETQKIISSRESQVSPMSAP